MQAQLGACGVLKRAGPAAATMAPAPGTNQARFSPKTQVHQGALGLRMHVFPLACSPVAPEVARILHGMLVFCTCRSQATSTPIHPHPPCRFIKEHWDEGARRFVPPVAPEADKEAVRRALPQGLGWVAGPGVGVRLPMALGAGGCG